MTDVYDGVELKQVLLDINADARTRLICKGLAKTSYKTAIQYAEKLPLRMLAEKEVKKNYET